MSRVVRISAAGLTAVCSYLLQAGLVSLAFAVTRATGDPAGLLGSTSMRLLVGGALCALVLGTTGLVVARGQAAADRTRQFSLPLLLSLVTGVLCLLVIEIGLRVAARPDALGARVGGTVLLPYDWEALATANRAMLERSRMPDAFYVPDSRLGWAVGPGRRSRDGLYASSAEGLRSERQGEVLAEGPDGTRVALYGDSFAFSEEVGFGDSLAPRLEAALGGDARVLNFGVPGYGVDQAVLRSRYTLPEWSPRVALLTFIEDDLYRIANIYAFLKVDWGLPVSKPRFVLRDGELRLLNSPVLAGDDLFGHPSIFELPMLDKEIEFQAQRWRRHPLHAFYLLRLLNGLFPTWPVKGEAVSEAAIAQLGTRIIQEFARATTAAGATPVIAYFPTSGDYNPGGRRVLKRRVLADLAAAGVPVGDLTGCVGNRIELRDLFVPGGHYSGAGNAVVAECLASLVRAAWSPGSAAP